LPILSANALDASEKFSTHGAQPDGLTIGLCKCGILSAAFEDIQSEETFSFLSAQTHCLVCHTAL
jgi:hypothetical protein